MLEKEKIEVIVEEFKETKKLLYMMFGKKIRYVLLTDALTDRTEKADVEGRYDIYLTTMRISDGRKLDIIGGALHESAHVIFSVDFPAPGTIKLPASKINLMEDIFVNHKIANLFSGSADYINATYDVADPNSPSNIYEALLSVNQTLIRGQGINFQYVDKFLDEHKQAFYEWLQKCMATTLYSERLRIHEEFLRKLGSTDDVAVTDVFSAISALLGTGVPNQCQGVTSGGFMESLETTILNGILKKLEEEVERKEDAKKLGGSLSIDYINVLAGDPDMSAKPNNQLVIRLSDAAYKTSLAHSGFIHGTYSGSLSKKKLHNYGYVRNGLMKPLFKRRETQDIATFFVLLDGSGSMDRYETYVKEITASLAASLNTRYSVFGGIFQEESLYICETFMPVARFGGGTPAIEAINAAGEMLRKRPGKKYIIFISDMEFDVREPEIPATVKLIKVGVNEHSKRHGFGVDCLLEELPNKLALLIKKS